MSKVLLRSLIRETLISEMGFDRNDGDISDTGESYPDLEIMPELEAMGIIIPNVDYLLAGEPIEVMKCNKSQCAAWVADVLDQTVGNAWHAHNAPGNLKFSAYNDIETYRDRAEKVFNNMNERNPVENLELIKGEPFKSGLAHLGETLADNFDVESNSKKLKMGDIVGLFHKGSRHYPDAFFEGATDYNLTQQKPLENTGPAFYDTETGMPWNDSMLGKSMTFKLFRPFGMNTHLGIVGGFYKQEPIIFHNVGGKISASLAKSMSAGNKSENKLVWAKTLPPAQKSSFLPNWMMF